MKTTPSQYLLSIIVVSYNTARLTQTCLESVIANLQTSSFLKNQSEIIVVDNDSSDQSVKFLKKFQTTQKLPVKLILNQENLGFAVANNQAIGQAKGKYLFLLNSDTIVHDQALEKLVVGLESASASLGLLAASLVNGDGSYQPQGGDLPTLFSLLVQWLSLDDLPIFGQFLPCFQKRHQKNISQSLSNQPVLMGWVGGTAVLIKKQVFQQIGLLDEKIFMYGEDSELCLRAARAGWGRAILPSAQVTHFGFQSSSANNAKLGEVKSLFYIFDQYYPAWQKGFLRLILNLGCFLRMIIFKLQGKTKLAQFYQQLGSAIRKNQFSV